MHAKTAVIAVALAPAFASAFASADVFFDQAAFENAVPGIAGSEDFEGITATSCTTVDGDGSVFSDFVALTLCCGGGNAAVCDFAPYSSAVLADGLAADTLRVDFDTPQYAVGFNVGASNFDFSGFGDVTVEAFDMGGAMLASETFSTSGWTMGTFIGLADLGAGIDRVEIYSSDFGAIDNLVYGVPATATTAPLVALLAVARRNRRR